MSSLNPQTLCNLYTLAEIQTKVDFYLDQLDKATVESYDKDSSQGRIKVVSAQIEKIESILQAWLKALECKNGLGKPRIVSHNFGGRGF